MPKIIPIILWIMAAIGLAVLIYSRTISQPTADDRPAIVIMPHNGTDPPGAILVDVPYKHLPDVPQFEMTDQTGTKFDSATLSGKPYLVSFFFASCPSICRDLNNQVDRLNEQLRKEEVTFVSLTVDPKNDTPEVLARYAADYDATPDRWVFLTDQEYKIQQLGEQVFEVVVDPANHTDNILLVDKWGRYRDRFKWDDPYDMKRLVEVVKDVAAEQTIPLNEMIHTRNVMAGKPPTDLNKLKWVREFHLIDANDEPFYSRDLTGEVWIANFFFTSCPEICKQQNVYLRGLRQRWKQEAQAEEGSAIPTIISITTDPSHDTPAVLNEFAKTLDADTQWKFLTGPAPLIERISSEFFNAHADNSHHSSRLFVIDKWHRVRGSFDWQNAEEEVAMLKLIEELKTETQPKFGEQ